jgi:membrane associated rhomboid family serine protease
VDQEREPILNAGLPRTPLVLALVLVALFAAQSAFADDSFVLANAFSWDNIERGRWLTLFTSLFLHGGWSHVLMNAVFILAFGTPLARYLGPGPGSAAVFMGFYLVTGALASLGFAAMHMHQAFELVGASGAGTGLFGATARLIGGRGQMGRLLSPSVIGMGAAILIINLLVGILGYAPGADGQQVAWEAHIAGFLAGAVLAGVLPRLRRQA